MKNSLIHLFYPASLLTGGLLAAFLSASCVKEEIDNHEPGSPILFGAVAGYEDESPTRTEYSGILYDVGSGESLKRYERIDWVKNSDWIRIFCLQAEDGPASDYSVTGDISESAQVSSSAEITPLSHYGLHWGTGTHYFYALYPAAGMKSNYQFKAESASTYSDRTVNASESMIEEVSGDATKAKITGVIPATQEVKLVRGSDLTPAKDFDEYKANMNYAYMYARNKVTAGSTGTVELAFKPLVTTFEFTLLAERDNAIASNLTQVVLRSSSTTMNKLSGTFTATLSETGDPVIASVGTTGSAITVKFPDGGVRLSETVPLKITILTLPFKQAQLRMELTFANGTTRKLELRSRNADTGVMEDVEVDACKKVYIRNVGVPEYHYYLEQDGPTVVLSDGTEAQILRHVSSSAGSVTAQYKSYRTIVGTSMQDAVDAPIYEYALAGADGNPETNADGSINWQPLNPGSLPSGLGITGVSSAQVGSTVNRTQTITIGAFPSGQQTESVNESQIHHERLVENTELYGLADNQDLSLYDIENLHSPRASGKPTTANCYIVDRAGSYRFPVVYGNSIDWTKNATVAPGWTNGHNRYAYFDGTYASGSTTTPANQTYSYMYCFTNTDCAKIKTPFVLDDVGLTKDNTEVVVVWEDVGTSANPLITVSNKVVYYSPGNLFWDPVAGAYKSSVPYIQFEVGDASLSNLYQGNALIAIRRSDVSSKPILWSWHIWVTDGDDVDGDGKGDGLQPMQVTVGTVGASGITSNQMMPSNIGWCDYSQVTRYKKDRIWYVRIRQSAGTAAPIAFKVIQSPPVTPTSYKGGDVYYQWGRKDPFLPSDGFTHSPKDDEVKGYRGLNKTAYSPGGYTITADDSSVNRAGFKRDASGYSGGCYRHAIRNPHVFYLCTFTVSDESDVWGSDSNWMPGTYHMNLWNMANLGGTTQSTDYKVKKTVYDPCPPGYCVPHRNAFTGFNTRTASPRGMGTGTILRTPVSGGTDPYYTVFPTADSRTIYFPWTGVRLASYYNETTAFLGRIYSVTKDGLSWTAAPKDRHNCIALYLDSGEVDALHGTLKRAQAFPVRPVKEIL